MRRGDERRQEVVGLRLLDEAERPAVGVHADQAEPFDLLAADGQHGDGDVGLGGAVALGELAVVHAVELVAGEDEHLVVVALGDVAEVLADGVGGALVPVGGLVGLLGGEDLDEAAVEHVELVGVADVLVQADGQELREDVDAVEVAVDAVGDRDVDQAVLAGDGHGGLGAVFGERVEAGAAAAAEDQAEDVAHGRGGLVRERAAGGRPGCRTS